MARNFDNPFSANVIGLWDFRPGFETDDTGLGDGIAQDGTAVGDPDFSGGWMLTSGSDDRLDVDDGNDAEFDLAKGTIITEFRQFSDGGTGADTVASRGTADSDEGFFEIRVTDDGAVEVYHRDGGTEALLSTTAGFVGLNDFVKVTYAWDDESGATLLVENSTTGEAETVETDVTGLTLDITEDGDQSFAIAARQSSDGDFDQYFNGAVDYLAVLDEPVIGQRDGIVDGSPEDDLIDLAYDGDPDGDVIDGGDAILPGEGPDDDIVDAGAGDDTIESNLGDDTVYAGSGDDTVDGGTGDDVIFGDGNLPGGKAGGVSRECFLWDDAPNPDGTTDPIEDGDDLSGGFSQDTGSVTVTYTTLQESPLVNTEFTTETQYTTHVVTDGNDANDQSGLSSVLNGSSNSAAYQLEFSSVVRDVSFRVNDIDGDGVVKVTAFDLDGNPIPVVLSGGPRLNMSDTDAVPGDDTADSDGGYADPNNSDYSLLVTIPGPVARFVIEHEQNGSGNTGILVTDVHFDVPLADTGDDGADTLIGGDGDDMIYGEGGDDTIDGGDGSDTVEGGDGDDTIDTSGSNPLPDRGFPSYDGLPAVPADPDVTDDRDTVDGGAGNDVIMTGDDEDIIDGGDGDDTIDGGLDDDTIQGGDGDDVIVGGEGSDDIQGGDGNDTIYGGLDPSFPDNLNIRDDGTDGPADPDPTNGMDVLDGGDGDDVIYGQDDDDVLIGGAGDDFLDGGIDEDTLYGGTGNDVLIGGQSGDVMYGEDGSDIIGIGVGDTAYGGTSAGDEDILIAIGLATVSYTDNDPTTGSGTVTFYNEDLSVRGTADFEEIEQVLIIGGQPISEFSGTGSSGPVVQAINGVVEGTDGADDIDLPYLGDPEGDRVDNDDAVPPLRDEEDVILGFGGDDTIHGRDDTDVIFGHSGDDTLYGDGGGDALDGGEGDDFIDGGEGRDIVAGGEGDDTITGSNDNALDGGDILYGQEGDDTFINASADDIIDGGEDADDGDEDTLDLTGVAEAANAGGSLTVEYTSADEEDGIVHLFDAGGTETGTIEFYNIENVVCFTPGTRIATPKGERLVETLEIGDRVITRDNGIQEIRWVGHKKLTGAQLHQADHLRPILIRKGALGNGLPERDMMLSPNHRVLVANDKAALYFEDSEVLVAAKHLVGMEGVEAVEVSELTYIHFMFDQHEVVLSDGAWTESFQPGDHSLSGLGNAQRNEIFELFPELKTREGLDAYQSARRSLKKHEALLLMH